MEMANDATKHAALNNLNPATMLASKNKLDHAGQVRSNMKSLVSVFFSSVITTLVALQFRLYQWLPPVEVFLIGQSAVYCFYLPPWIHSSRFVKQSSTTRKNKRVYLYLVLHCIIIVSAALMYYQSLKLLSPTVAYTIGSMSPFFSLILSRIIFKENITVIKVIALLVTILSVVLTSVIGKSLSTNGSTAQFVTGIALSIGSCLVGSTTFLTFKKLSSWNMNLVCVAQGTFASVVGLIVLFSSGSFVVPQCGVTAVVILCCGLGSALNTIVLFYACKFGDAGKVCAMLTAMNIVFSMIWEVAFFGGNPYILQYISALLAISGTALNGFDKYITYPKFLSKAL